MGRSSKSVYPIALIAGGLIALVLIWVGLSPYIVLASGVVVLVFRRQVVRSGARLLLAAIEKPWFGQKATHNVVLATTRRQRAEKRVSPAPTKPTPQREYSKEEGEAFFQQHAADSVFLVPTRNSAEAAGTQLGGLPRLPENTPWPGEENGQPLHFLASIDLSQVPPLDATRHLEKTGYLFFFAGIWGGGHAVIRTEDLGSERTAPNTLPVIDEHVRQYNKDIHFPQSRIFPGVAARMVVCPFLSFETNPEVPYELGKVASKAERAALAPSLNRADLSGIDQLVPIEGAYIHRDGFGGEFPWTNGIALEVLNWFVRSARRSGRRRPIFVSPSDPIYLKDAIRRRMEQSRDAAKLSETRRANAQRLEIGLIGFKRLQTVLRSYPASSRISKEDASSFEDVLLALTPGPTGEAPSRERLSKWLMAALAPIRTKALSGDELGALPSEFIEKFRPEFARNSYNYHMVCGPKWDRGNPTEGQGVKLLQLDSDDALGFLFGDCGVIEFWISEENLAAGRFEATEFYLSTT